MLTLLGCIPPEVLRYSSSVMTISDPSATELRSFLVFPGGADTDTNNLQFRELRAYLVKALLDRGFTLPAPGTAPDVILFANWGIGDPQQQTYTTTMPVFGKIGGGTSTVTGTTTGPGGTSTTTGTVTTPTQRGVIGTIQRTNTSTSFTRHLLLRAVNMRLYQQTGVIREAWRTAVVSSGSSPNLRAVLPYMIVAASPYFGVNTPDIIEVDIQENDPRVQGIRGPP